ncbi:hypothetical protein [Streptomyces sp. NPDC127098]|uniref:hypothetical protein n=1 Tax=Streptomyces sp. NPDC127098 TaxID=3347137 RepID=UPI003653396C
MSTTRSSRSQYGSRLLVSWAIISALTVASCASDPEDDASATEPSSGVPATQVCDGTISQAAAGEFEEITGRDEFRDSGYRSATSPDLAGFLEVLRESASRWEGFCRVYGADEERPIATLEFGWREAVTSNGETDPSEVAYATGEYAYTQDGSAFLEFACPVDSVPGGYLAGDLFTYDVAAGDGHIAVLNSVSRAVAERFGCLDESGLAEGAPERLAG